MKIETPITDAAKFVAETEVKFYMGEGASVSVDVVKVEVARKLERQLNTLREHVEGYHMALEADLDMGSHHMTNRAYDEYNKANNKYHYTNQWLMELFAIAREGED